MPIPDHRAIATDAMRRLVVRAGDLLVGPVHVCADPEPGAGLDPLRRTRVPFFKVCLTGSFTIAACRDRPARAIRRGEACLFTAGSFVNDHFPRACRFLRVTVERELTFVAEERIPVGEAAPEDRRLRAHSLHRPLDPCAHAALARLADAERDGLATAHRHALVRLLLAELGTALEQPPRPELASAERYRDICHYLDEHACRPIDRASTAAALGVSPGHVSRLFRRHGQRSFAAALVERRLANARALLRDSELSIAEIAERCGFASATYFGQAFRSHHGCSPSAWRSVGHRGRRGSGGKREGERRLATEDDEDTEGRGRRTKG